MLKCVEISPMQHLKAYFVHTNINRFKSSVKELEQNYVSFNTNLVVVI